MIQGVYSNQWVPPISVSNNLAAWKNVMNDIRHSIIEAGLIETENSDLVIDNVSSLPSDGNYVAGSLEFAFDDELQATHPVLLQMQLGCGASGSVSNNSTGSGQGYGRMPRIRWRIVVSGHQSDWIYCPQPGSYSQPNNTLSSPGWAAITYYKEKGFFGFVHGVGSVGKPMRSNSSSRNANYYGATFTCFIQRTLDRFGEITGEGAAIYGPALTLIAYNSDTGTDYWSGYKVHPSICQYVSAKFGKKPISASSVRYQGDQSGHDIIQTQPVVFVSDNSIQSFPYLVHYLLGDIPEQEVFEIKPSNSDDYMPFIALGNETCLSSENMNNRSCFAMLFAIDEEPVE